MAFNIALVDPASIAAPNDTDVKLDHNYPSTDSMRFLDATGDPVASAKIRIYKLVAGAEVPVSITTTASDGRWTQPSFVPPGFTYKVRFEKTEAFGPDEVELVL